MHRLACLATCFAVVLPHLPAQQPPAPLSVSDAEKTIATHTHIAGCSNSDAPVFTGTRTGTPTEYKLAHGSQETRWLYPVKVHYTVHCTSGNRNMRHGEVEDLSTEVKGEFRLYRDPYGELRVADNLEGFWYWYDLNDWNNQGWDDSRYDVHCRDQRMAYNTYDPSTGKLVKTRPDPNLNPNIYGKCSVVLNVDK